MGEGDDQAPVGDPGDQSVALLLRPAMAQKAAAQYDGGEVRFERQSAAERFHHDHGFDRPAAGAAIPLRKRQPEQPEFGILPPQLAAPALGALSISFALLEGVAIADQPVEAL